MQDNKIRVLFVCVANFCRSPVAEKILSSIISENNHVDSCGLHPKIDSRMDPRSENFLKNNHFLDLKHNPKKITKQLVNNSDVVFAMDIFVLQELKKLYNHKNIKLFSYFNKDFYTPDPYHYSNNEYEFVMNLIKEGCESIKMNINKLSIE